MFLISHVFVSVLSCLDHPQTTSYFSTDLLYLALDGLNRVRVTALMGLRLPSLVADAALLSSHFNIPIISRYSNDPTTTLLSIHTP
jgi:hypothetical protein